MVADVTAAAFIDIRDLAYTYADGRPALRGVSLSVSEGESLGVIGPNGAGKTTLLLHLNGILRVAAGQVRILGLDAADGQNLKAIRGAVGMVFQNPDDQLFSPTVFDDISFGPLNMGLPEEEVARHVDEALRLVGMTGYAQRTPHHLSTGEKKRLSIATVLSLPCRVLVLDEPTSNLDPRARTGMIRLLKSLEQTKVIAGHDLEMMLEVCTRVIIMDGGKIVAEGTPAGILRNERLMSAHHLEVPLSLSAGRAAGGNTSLV